MLRTEGRAVLTGLDSALCPQPAEFSPDKERSVLNVLLAGFRKLFCPTFFRINTQIEHLDGLGSLRPLPAARGC